MEYQPSCEKCPLRRGERPDLAPHIRHNAKLTIVMDAPEYADREEQRWCGGRVGRMLSVWLQKLGVSRDIVSFTGAHLCLHHGTESESDLKRATACCRPNLLHALKDTGAPVLAAGKWAASSVFAKPNVVKWMGAEHQAVGGLEHLRGRITYAIPSLYFGRGEGRIEPIFNHLAWTLQRAPWAWPAMHTSPTPEALDLLRRWAAYSTPLGVDIETSSGPVESCGITCVGIADLKEAVSLEWPIPEPYLTAVRVVLANAAPKILHNGTFDAPILARHGLPLGGPVEDTLVALSIVKPLLPKGLGPACAVEFPWDRWKSEFTDLDEETTEVDGQTFWDRVDPLTRRVYNAKDAWAGVRLWSRLVPRIYDWELYANAKRLDQLAAGMRTRGVGVDLEVKAFMLEGASALRERAERACNLIAESMDSAGINLRSPKQLNGLFFTKFGLKPLRYSEKTGEPALDEWVLQQLAEMGGQPALMAKALMEFREYDKVISTFLEGCPVTNGRAHFDWKVWSTVTGRWSSSPNAQNYPKHLRAMFTSPGHIVGPDYKQLEVRIIAQQAGVKKLLDAFEAGDDIYKIAARDLFDTKTLEAVTDSQRKAAKQFVLGGNYGGGSETLWEQMSKKGFKIAWQDVDMLLKRYLTVFAPEIPEWHRRTVRQAKADGYVAEPMTGRRRPVTPWSKPTEIVNFPIQAMAGAIANRAILRLVETRHPDDHIIFQVHDEITVEGPNLERLEAWVRGAMPMTLRINGIPMLYDIDIKSGSHWGTME